MKAIIALLGISFILLILSNNISIANWVEKENQVSQKSNIFSEQDSSVINYFKSNIKVLKDDKGNNLYNTNSVGPDTLTITGQSLGEKLGSIVSNAGDVNGDGYSDVIIAANGISKAYIYFGGLVMNNIADIELSESESGYFGLPVSTAGDVNGDGYSDVIVGAYGYNGGTGRVYIYYGGANMNNVADVILTGEAVNNYFNNCSSAGDVNGDGYSDVIVGAWGYSTATGRAYIYYGGSSMNNVADVVLTGEGINSGFGISVANAGDVNGDSYSDVIVGAHAYNAGTGRTYIYYGGASMNNTADVIMTGEVTGDNFYNCSTAGDVNGDGYSDVIVGANLNNGSRGKAYIYYGGTAMNNIADVTLTGEAADNHFGNSVSTAGDVNGDGYSDVTVGAWGYNNNIGRAYIYYGGISMNNLSDITMNGEAINNYFGYSVCTLGDVNRDGNSDLIVGAYGYNDGTGRAYLNLNLGPKPGLILPINNSINNGTTVSFKWRKQLTSLYYYLNVGTDSTFNSIIINDTISIDTFKTVNGLNKGTKYYWRVISKNSNGTFSYSSTWNFTTAPGIKLSMKILMEGMYFPIFNQMTRKDTMKVYICQSESPFNKIDSATSTIDSLSFKGLFKFQNAPMGTYYIVAKHFNSIETWSKSGGVPMTTTDTTFYDFTSASSQAYGNNLKSKGSKFCMFGGNVNGDGIVDGGDLSEADNDSFSGLSGRFLRSDVNGDNIVDAADVSLVDNNSYNSIVKISP